MTTRTSDTRATRLALRGRLEQAEHAIELLQMKEEALRRERVRLEGHASRTARLWAERSEDARSWLLRARALGAGDELAAIAKVQTPRATVETNWRDSMGVSYPGEVTVHHAATPPVTTTAALVPTARAHRRALDAGADHAAATTALHRVADELAATRRRRRAIEHRLVPTLTERVRDLELRLDEDDRAQALRSQLATRPRNGS